MPRVALLLAAAVCYVLGVCSADAWRGGTDASPTAVARATERDRGVKAKGVDLAMSAAPPTEKFTGGKPTAGSPDGKLRIICFGAHPDDCEIKAGGVAALWAAAGHHVKFVSLTNGDIGHWREAGGPLARRRNAEVQHAASLLGITSEVLDNHDGELQPTLENRRTVTRLIREWHADLVMGPRTNDYHPDHRYTGILVQDAAYMVAVPFFCPDTPHLSQNPVFLYYSDHFQKPYPFQADVVVGVDRAIEQKLDGLVGMESQFVEGGVSGSPELIAGGEPKLEERRKVVRESFRNRDRGIADKYREQLTAEYGKEAAAKIHYAEAFEVCEYGRQPSKEELRTLFPFFGSK